MPCGNDSLSVNAPVAEEQVLDEEEGERRKSGGPTFACTLLKHCGAYYIQSPDKVQKLLNVERYAERWPLIRGEELHGSSVEHPEHPEWRWLLHTRRVPIHENTRQGNAPLRDSTVANAEQRPPCAGVGDAGGFVWACWGCLSCVADKNPRMPLNALVNDNWLGREKKHVREASVATKMLASLARCCYRQVRLGKGAPDVQQKAICGNSIFLAQPTAQIPVMELPPPDDALLEGGFSVIFTRSVQDLSKAQWATVKRAEYLRIVRERKHECATFAGVAINEEAAPSRLPEDGVPAAIQACALHVDGADKAPVHLTGPASRAPEVGREDEAGEESEESEEDDEADEGSATQPAEGHACDDIAEATVAVDPVHHVAPVRAMQALQARIQAVQDHAVQISRNEAKKIVADNEGALQSVEDAGGRDAMKSIVVDLQSSAKNFGEKAERLLEQATAGAERCRAVTPQALAVPTNQPLDSFDARTYLAAWPEFWYGDGAPNLERDRYMLYEEVARMLPGWSKVIRPDILADDLGST